MTVMPDMRRRTPEPPAGPPQIQVKPGTANELLHQLAPLLAEEGIDVNNIDASDPGTLQQALNRASSGTTWPCSPPSGTPASWPPSPCGSPPKPSPAATPRSPPGSWTRPSPNPRTIPRPLSPPAPASRWACSTTGHPGTTPAHPTGWARLTRLPAGHWTGERAATDILTLARKRRAFASLDALIVRQCGRYVLYGSALALAAALQAWARHAGTPLTDLARTVVR